MPRQRRLSAALVAGALFTCSYYDNRKAIAAQAGQFDALQRDADPVCRGSRLRWSRSTSMSRSHAMDAVAGARTLHLRRHTRSARTDRPRRNSMRAQTDTYDQALRNLLEPRMVALLEATMWRQIRDPDFMLGALKTYRMMTGLSQMDTDFAQNWWVNELARIRHRSRPFRPPTPKSISLPPSAAWRSTTAMSRPTRRWWPRR